MNKLNRVLIALLIFSIMGTLGVTDKVYANYANIEINDLQEYLEVELNIEDDGFYIEIDIQELLELGLNNENNSFDIVIDIQDYIDVYDERWQINVPGQLRTTLTFTSPNDISVTSRNLSLGTVTDINYNLTAFSESSMQLLRSPRHVGDLGIGGTSPAETWYSPTNIATAGLTVRFVHPNGTQDSKYDEFER